MSEMQEDGLFTVGSLFSGYGGLELGLERTGRFRTAWHCEIEEFPSAILADRWAGVPNIGDITKVDWRVVERVDCLCGGFPCQDVSVAGKKRGLKEGTRTGLWFEFVKAIRVLQPRWVLAENVSGLITSGGLAIVLRDLAREGYDAEWQTISAAELGAPHRRERVFIVGTKQRGDVADADNTGPFDEVCAGRDAVGRSGAFNSDAESKRFHRQGVSLRDETSFAKCGCVGDERAVADADCGGLEGSVAFGRDGDDVIGSGEGRVSCWAWFPSFAALCRGDDGSPFGMDAAVFQDIVSVVGEKEGRKIATWVWKERIKALGNGVVPACAEEAARRMM